MGETLDRLYEEALQLQVDMTRVGRGLTFLSFKVVLNNVMKECGDCWMGLVQKQMQAYLEIEEAAYDHYSSSQRRVDNRPCRELLPTSPGMHLLPAPNSPTSSNLKRKNRYMEQTE